jgi:hypothetical protein
MTMSVAAALTAAVATVAGCGGPSPEERFAERACATTLVRAEQLLELSDDVVHTRAAPGRDAWAQMRFILRAAFVETRDDGAVVIPIPEHEIVWTTEPFGEERRVLNGVGARTIPLDLLRSGKQMTREAPDEAAKDRADVQALAAARSA